MKIPSKDRICLIASTQFISTYYPESFHYCEYSGLTNNSSCCIHIGSIKWKTTRQQLLEYFSLYAIVKQIQIIQKDSIPF